MLGLGIALIHEARPAEALLPLEKYLSLFPDHEQALFGKAVALQQTGKHAESVEQYRKVLARNPRCEEALSNLVAMFLEKKDHESVRRYAEMLCELQPDSPVATEALATLAFQDGDYLTAARHCRTLSETAPDRFENWFNLGVAHHKMGNYEKAAQAYQQAGQPAARSRAIAPESGRGAAGIERPGRRARQLRARAQHRPQPDPACCGTSRSCWSSRASASGPRSSTRSIPEDAPEWCDATFRLGYLRLLRGDYPPAPTPSRPA